MAAAAAGAGSGPWATQEKQFPPVLLSFFIYNPRFGPREGEEENKILFYHPNEVEKNEKIRNVGLCEAIVQFTRTFSPSKPAKSLHTQKNRQFFNEPEEHFWMVMVVRNPIIEKQSKDGKPVIEYQEEELLDKVYSSVLQQCYSMYKLFNGTFLKAMEDGGVELLKERLEKFFHRYLQTLHLQSCDLLDIFGGISFFPLDKMTYLKIQSFINRVEESLNIVKYTAFLYNDQLIWSGLEQDDMRILYKYLTTSLFPRHMEPELAGRDSPIRAEMPGNLQHYGRFLTGPLNLNDPDAKCRFPKIFVNTHDAYEELHLIVYKAMSAAVCFMIDASIQPTLDFCRRLDSVVGPQLTVLASDICEQFNINKRMSGSEKEPQFKFIYFNHMNLAEKSTVHMRKTPSVSLTSVHPDLMKILGDINSDFTRVDEDEEIIVKAMSDYWVVGKKSDRRELYVILNQKNANLIEVNGKRGQETLCNAVQQHLLLGLTDDGSPKAYLKDTRQTFGHMQVTGHMTDCIQDKGKAILALKNHISTRSPDLLKFLDFKYLCGIN
ncbi:vacuolar fusion protein CCZ1 homolog B isoform X1 [Theropithecus gelada]|uniref:vacuolar fusion protein CCZ1 homolog B isoform X1 n=1 Tax=Theropithecus gelada TaxID=9565 RepID=UPI000DC1B5DD|nr:vacuolar fusion protein CCZ1 homolog B isoform X1 [Theropithecus gelada]